MPSIDWNSVSALAAAASAIAAAVQIGLMRKESSQRSTFEHLREVDLRLQAIWSLPPQSLRDSVAEAYSRGRNLTDAEREYLAFLNGLDLLAFAREAGVVNRKLTDRYLRTVVREELVSLTSIRALQNVWNDRGVYEHLYSLLVDFQSKAVTNVRGQP